MGNAASSVPSAALVVAALATASLGYRRDPLPREAPAATVRSRRESADTPVDPSVATVAELESLPGVGPALAARIVAHRETHGPYLRLDDLDAVKGVGPAMLRRLAPRVRFQYRSTTQANRPTSPTVTTTSPDG